MLLIQPLFSVVSSPETLTGPLHVAEQLLHQVALSLKIIAEFIAILIIAIALIISLQTLLRRGLSRGPIALQGVRLTLGLALALSLEFLLAADIVGTAVSPGWDAIAQLAAVTGIRTFLNFFLQREVRELQTVQDRHLAPPSP
jgi:uncharacterized membrane protein